MKDFWRKAISLQGIVDRGNLDSQLAARQPSWLLLIVPFALFWSSKWLLYLALWLLPERYRFSTSGDLPRLLWMAASIAFISTHSSWLIWKFRPSIGSKTSLPKIVAVGISMGFPLILIHLYIIKKLLNSLDVLLRSDITKQEFREVLGEAHDRLWSPFGWGVDELGIVLASLGCFIVPIYEELILSGFTATKLARHFKVLTVILLHASIFAGLHIFVTGLHPRIFLYCVWGAVYLTARFISGSWLSALAAHWIANFMFMLPRWGVAFVLFSLPPGD